MAEGQHDLGKIAVASVATAGHLICSQKTFFFAMGLCGLCIVVMELASLAAGRGPLLEEAMLTSAGATTLIGCLMASILGVYLAKSLRDKRRPAGDEE